MTKIESDEINDNEEELFNQTRSPEDLYTSTELSIEDSRIMYPYFPENNGIMK